MAFIGRQWTLTADGVTIGCITNLSHTASVNILDATCSETGMIVHVPGDPDPGEWSFTGNLAAGSDGDNKLMSLLETPEEVQWVASGPVDAEGTIETYTIPGILTAYNKDGFGSGEIVTFDATVKANDFPS